MTTREQVMDALLAKLAGAGGFVTIGRRNRDPDSFSPADTPALMLVEHSEAYRSPSTAQPPIRRLTAMAILYTDAGSDLNAIPATAINDRLDAIDAVLVPDNAMTGKCTLGGLVQSVVIEGVVKKAPGDVTGKSLAIIPLTILLP